MKDLGIGSPCLGQGYQRLALEPGPGASGGLALVHGAQCKLAQSAYSKRNEPILQYLMIVCEAFAFISK